MPEVRVMITVSSGSTVVSDIGVTVTVVLESPAAKSTVGLIL